MQHEHAPKPCLHVAMVYMSGNQAFAGGVDQAVISRARYLRDIGHRVTILCQANVNFIQRHERDGVQVWPVSVPNLARKRTGVLHPLLPARMAAELEELQATEPIDVVDLHDSPLFEAVEAVLEKHSIPSCFSIHAAVDYIPEQRFFPIQNYLKRHEMNSATKADVCIPVSRYISTAFTRKGLLEEKFHVVHNAIQPDFFEAGSQRTFDESTDRPLRIIFTGRLTKVKDAATAIRALSLVKDKSRFRFEILGRGGELTSCRALVQRLGLGSVVHFPGFIGDRNKLLAKYAESDVFVLPTRFEAFSMSILEAMAAGLTCCTTDIPPCVEALGDAGLLFPVGGAEQLAAHLDRLAEDRSLLRCYSEKARAKAAEYLPDRAFASLPDVYRYAKRVSTERRVARVKELCQKTAARFKPSDLPEKPRISVVIPAYNVERYIQRAIHSVRSQTVPVDEIFVCDDCSTDATAELARMAGATVLTGPKANGSVARNRGAKAATGDLLFFLDGDDWWHPLKVEMHLAAHRLVRPSFVFDPAITYHDPLFGGTMGAVGDSVAEWERFLDWRYWASGSCFSMRRDDYWRVGGFNEELIAQQDVDLWVKAGHDLGPALRIPFALTYYRVLPTSVSRSPKNVSLNLQAVFRSWPFLTDGQKRDFERQTYLTAARWSKLSQSIIYVQLARWPILHAKTWRVLGYSMMRSVATRRSGRLGT